MYVPQEFVQQDKQTLHAFMREHSFATLITQQAGAPFATHVPLLLHSDQGEYGTLIGHMARANPQWQEFSGVSEVLAIFHGPHAYVSPAWYQGGQGVPTWNYATVHAYGAPRLIEGEDALLEMLKEITGFYESGYETPWQLDVTNERLKKLTSAIVGFKIPIIRLEGKFKLNQNRALADQLVVAEKLGQGDSASRAVANLMQHGLQGKD